MQAVEYLQWWGAHYPHANPRTHSTSKHCWWVQTNHMWQVGKSPVAGKGERGTGHRFPAGHAGQEAGACCQPPFLPSAAGPSDGLLPLKSSPNWPLCTSVTPQHHPLSAISPGGRTKGRGRGQKGSGLTTWKFYRMCNFFSPLSLVMGATSGSPERLVLSRGAALIVESSAGSDSSQKGNGWLLDSPRGNVCISFSFRNRLDMRFHQDCQGNAEQRSSPTVRSPGRATTLHTSPLPSPGPTAGITIDHRTLSSL